MHHLENEKQMVFNKKVLVVLFHDGDHFQDFGVDQDMVIIFKPLTDALLSGECCLNRSLTSKCWYLAFE